MYRFPVSCLLKKNWSCKDLIENDQRCKNQTLKYKNNCKRFRRILHWLHYSQVHSSY